MEGNDSKAHVVTKIEPPTKHVLDRFVKMEAVETFNFPKTEKVEPFINAESFGLPKIEKSEGFWKTELLDCPKMETIKPHDFSKAKAVKLFGFPLNGSTFMDEKREDLLLQLSRIRDFIRLLLSYPMKTVHDGKLKAWVHEASNRGHSLDYLNRLLSQNPLNFFQGFLPMYILKNVDRGWSPQYGHSNGIPGDILSLSANLAVNQLIQTLLFEDDHVRNIHHVLFYTRDAAEKRLVKDKLQSFLKDKEIMLRLQGTFTRVLLIDVSDCQSHAVEVQVQQQISQQLHLPVIEGNDYLLLARLEKEMSRKKYLVLLVDGEAKEPLNPRNVGFPEEIAGVVVCITTESSKQANSKLMATMDLNINTKDHLLPWQVFCENIGIKILPSSDAERMAVRIVKECSDHLLAGVIVAKSLRNAEYIEQWEHAMDKLCSLHPSYDIGMFQGQSSVFLKAFINVIWHDLSKTQKYCLASCLFISRFGKHENDLINDWISSRVVDAREAKHNLRELVDRFALLQLEDSMSRYIHIPQDTYATLQILNTRNPLFMKKSGLGLVEAPNSELWHGAICVDLADNQLSELPLSLNCHELKVLKLHKNADLIKIPARFFLEMRLLCILDLSYTSVRELPNSFFELEQLRELHMKSCGCFMKLSSEVGKLKNLEKIDLDKTQITHLPKEIQELTNLQSLTLCLYEYCGKKSKEYTSSSIIPYGVISKLKGLKQLSIDVNPDDERWEENLQVILPEISALENLQTISLYIPALELLNLIPASIFGLDFRFIVGRHKSRIISSTLPAAEEKFKQSERSLKFVNGVDVPYEITSAVRHSKALFLDRHMTIKDISKFGMTSLEQLQVCVLAECKEMQTIVDGRCSISKDILPRLLVLSVSYMKNLRSICEGEVHSCHSFGMLKTLALHNCPKLKTVFTLDFLGNLSLLNDLVVKDCPKVSSLISYGPSKLRAGTFLPKLRTMALFHLPELISISNGLHVGPNLEKIGIYDCPKLQRLSKMDLSSPNLKLIKGETEWWEALSWSDEEACGIISEPPIFDCIFSPIDKEADIMSQMELDDDIDDNPVSEPPHSSSSKVSKDVSSSTIGEIEGETLQSSSGKVSKDMSSRSTKESLTRISESLEDGFSWRKYRQITVPFAKFPRSYFRCTHKFDQGCKATKQVQRIYGTRLLYRTTYFGNHTCTQVSDMVFQFGAYEIGHSLELPYVERSGEGKRSFKYKVAEDEAEEEVEDEEGDEEEALDEFNSGEDHDGRKKMRDRYSKRGSSSSPSMAPSCQVESCESDLSEAKHYHRLHKVCELHAKAASVLIAGLPQRFCQQCSRFHELEEFDDTKRSCTKRLAEHYERRTKNAYLQYISKHEGMTVDEPLQPSNDEVFKDKTHSRKRGGIPIVTIKSKSLDDGYSWRKYGQKEILGAKFPRGYYRCSHRKVQGCLAAKQVQIVDEDPFLYDVTYRGCHTCTQTSTVTDSSMNNQVDLRTRSGLDDDATHYHLALQPSSSRVTADQKQTGIYARL